MYIVASGSPGQDQGEDPEAGEGHPGPEGRLPGPMCDQVSHTSGVW